MKLRSVNLSVNEDIVILVCFLSTFQVISAALSLGAVFTVVYLDEENRKLKERVESLEGKNYGAAITANCQAVSHSYQRKIHKIISKCFWLFSDDCCCCQ